MNESIKSIELYTDRVLTILIKKDYSENEFLFLLEDLKYLIFSINLKLKEYKKQVRSIEEFHILQHKLIPMLKKLQQIKIYKFNDDYDTTKGTATSQITTLYDDMLQNMYQSINEQFK